MKFHVVVWATAVFGLVSIGAAQSAGNIRALVAHRIQEREAIYALLVSGHAQEAMVRLAQLPVPEGMSSELFVAGELFRLSLEARNAQEPEAAAQAANIALDLLNPPMVARQETRRHRAQAFELKARIHELVIPDSNAARAAWQLVLAEEPDNARAAGAIRKIDDRAALAARQRAALARDPMLQPGFVPVAAQPGINP